MSRPDAAVTPDGAPVFGSWTTPLPSVALTRARVAGWPGPLGRLRLKQWEHWLVVTPELALTFAAVDAVFTRLTWIQMIDRRTGARWEHRREGPLVSVSLADALYDGRSHGRSAGLAIDLHNHLDAGGHRAVCHGKTRDLPEIAVDLWAECPLPATEPLVVVLPVGRGRAMYSHKVPLPVSGTITVDGVVHGVDRASATAILDVHKAHYPRTTWWNWATAVGFDVQGRRLAFNLTRNIADAGWHENAAWIDGRSQNLGPDADFSLAADPWQVAIGGTRLAFTAAGERSEDLDYGVVQSRFRQRYGTFSGMLQARPDERIEVKDWFGLMEDHHARW